MAKYVRAANYGYGLRTGCKMIKEIIAIDGNKTNTTFCSWYGKACREVNHDTHQKCLEV